MVDDTQTGISLPDGVSLCSTPPPWISTVDRTTTPVAHHTRY